jgi:acid phosphatase (class A)
MIRIVVALGVATLAGSASAQTAAGPAALGRMPTTPGAAGYMTDAARPDTYAILPPAPVAGTSRYEADRTIFLQTRRLKDASRWALAQNDVDQTRILHDLACAVGVELTEKNAPKTVALTRRINIDVRPAVNRPKDIYKRQRPYLIDEGPICVDKTDDLAKSADYPSGHNTWGWTIGLVMAELAPDRSTDILKRARAYGESRLVCGVHNLSAVEAGRLNASIVVAGLHGSPEFRKDMDVARTEIAAARRAGPAPDAAACAAEAKLIDEKLY